MYNLSVFSNKGEVIYRRLGGYKAFSAIFFIKGIKLLNTTNSVKVLYYEKSTVKGYISIEFVVLL